MNKSRSLSNQPNLFSVVKTIAERDAIPNEILFNGYLCIANSVVYEYDGTQWNAANAHFISGISNISGTFTTVDGKTITVSGGLVTNIS